MEENPELVYENQPIENSGTDPDNIYENQDAKTDDDPSNVYMNDGSVQTHEPSTYENLMSTPDKTSNKKSKSKESKKEKKTSKPEKIQETSISDEEEYDVIGPEPTIHKEPKKDDAKASSGLKSKFQNMFKKGKNKKDSSSSVEEEPQCVYEEPVGLGTNPEDLYDELMMYPPEPGVTKPPVPDLIKPEPVVTNSNTSKNTVTISQPYQGKRRDELTVSPGDVVRDVEESEPGWMMGTLRGKTGVFPDSCIKAPTQGRKISITERALPPVPVEKTEPVNTPSKNPPPAESPETKPNPKPSELILRRGNTPANNVLRSNVKSEVIPNNKAETNNNARMSVAVPKEPVVSRFSVRDKVRLEKDQERVKTLQVGHGGWVDAMEEVLGKVGEVADIHKSGDVFVKFESLYRRIHPDLLSSGAAVGEKQLKRRLTNNLQARVNRMTNREEVAE